VLFRSYLWLCGVALGLAVATKWSAVYSLLLLAALAVGREAWLLRTGAERSAARALLTGAAAFVAVPGVLYLGAYVQFFLMGHTWAEWRELQWQIWRYHSTLTACHDWASPAWTWPFLLRPVWYHVARYPDGAEANVFAMGNPLLWWVFLSAVAVAGVDWVRSRGRAVGLGLILLGFLGQWVPWLGSPRIAYLYHMLPSVPFGCLAVAWVLGRLWRGWTRPVVAAYLAAVLLIFLFFYSHAAALPVSADYTGLHYWLPTWQPGTPWAFGCPPAPRQ
jgi:dolichyl-phosphate-mannose-protein mannosyltransferase